MLIEGIGVVFVLWIKERRPVVVCDNLRAILYPATKAFHISVEFVSKVSRA
jgi:hypothetical protein